MNKVFKWIKELFSILNQDLFIKGMDDLKYNDTVPTKTVDKYINKNSNK